MAWDKWPVRKVRKGTWLSLRQGELRWDEIKGEAQPFQEGHLRLLAVLGCSLSGHLFLPP